MPSARVLLAGLWVTTAVLLQGVVVERLSLPFGRPDLVALVVVAVALTLGSGAGLWAGFGGGLLLDLLADHPLGLLAVTLCVVGYLAGVLADDGPPPVLVSLLVVAVGVAATMLVFVGLLQLFGGVRADLDALPRLLPAAVGYDLLLAPFVLPAVTAVGRRLESAGVL